MNKGLKKLIALVVLLVIALAGLTAVRAYLEEKDAQAELNSRVEYAPMVEDDDPVWLAYRERYPDTDVQMACSEDINDDGLRDIVVIWRPDPQKGECFCLALISAEDGGYFQTPVIAAPQQHQRIRFFNMDHEGFLEVLITGDKNGNIGYAIYRLIDGELIDLFGEGMEDCC